MNGIHGIYSDSDKKRNPKTGYSEYYMDSAADAGRYGDDRIGIVDNEPAHINAWEEHLINSYGEIGEEITKQLGSGTTNPNTGLKEYNHIFGISHEGWDNSVGSISDMNLAEGAVYLFTAGALDISGGGHGSEGNSDGSLWDWTFGGNDTKWFSNEKTDDFKSTTNKKNVLDSTMSSTMETMSNQLGESLGSDGSIAQGYNTNRALSSNQTGNAYSKQIGQQDQVKANSGFATMGAANQSFDFSDARLGAKQSYRDEVSDKSDLVTSLQKELNTMTGNYVEATGESYSSSSLDDLQRELDLYQS